MRDPEHWYRSAMATVFRTVLDPWWRKLATLAAVLARPHSLPYILP